MRPGLILMLVLALWAVAGEARAGSAASARDDGALSFGAGTFNTSHARRSGGIDIAYRLNSRPWKPRRSGTLTLVPVFGVTASSKNALFVYAGLRTDLDLGERWRLTPGLSVGAYRHNDDIDLGGPVEFRSSLDISRAFRNGVRVGVSLYHISNARLYEMNPGINALVFVQTF